MRVEREFPAMGTVNSVVAVVGEGEKDLAAACLGRIREKVCGLDDTLSVFKETSEVSRLNRLVGEGAVAVSEDTYQLLGAARRYGDVTGGAFDVTAGELASFWKAAIRDGKEPSRACIERARALVNYRDILLAGPEGARTARLARSGMRVDLGGIAKGYAARLAAAELRASGITRALVNFGGTVVAIGGPWEVGVRSPAAPRGARKVGGQGESVLGTLAVRDQAIVTSGAYEQCRVVGGRLVHHIVDPRTGKPAASSLSSVTLVCKDPCALDALATGAFVLGAEKAARLLAEQEVDAVMVTASGEVLVTPGLSASFIPAGLQEP